MIPIMKPFVAPRTERRIADVFASGMIAEGPVCAAFEEDLRAWLGVEDILAVNSGTSALQLALYLAGVRKGDVVISTPMTCTATNTAIVAMGGIPYWCDIDPKTGNMDPVCLAEMLEWGTDFNGKRVRAVLCVHWGGLPCDLDALRAVCDAHELPLVEDAAHAFGAEYHGHKIGNHGDFVCFSFQAVKHLTTVDGGGLVCRFRDDHERGKLLRWFGLDRTEPRDERVVYEPGWKYHLNDVLAAIGRENIKHTRVIVDAHRANALWYDQHLGRQTEPEGVKSAFWFYPVLVDDAPRFQAEMRARGIDVSTVHTRNDIMTKAFGHRVQPLPGADWFARHQMNVPCGWWITPAERDHITHALGDLL